MERNKKVFVLDTSVGIADPDCLFSFGEHDVVVPYASLCEFDGLKNDDARPIVAQSSRKFSRTLESLISSCSDNIGTGIQLDGPSSGLATGRLYFRSAEEYMALLPAELSPTKPDNQMLALAKGLCDEFPEREVVMVSGDINLRILAKILGIRAEVYRNGQVSEITLDRLDASVLELPSELNEYVISAFNELRAGVACSHFKIDKMFGVKLAVGQCICAGADPEQFFAVVRDCSNGHAILEVVPDYRQAANAICGVSARNVEQVFYMHHLMSPAIDLVIGHGPAGTGKTFLALAAAQELLRLGKFSRVIVTRAMVPVGGGKGPGWFPGDKNKKTADWMGAINDNLRELKKKTSLNGGAAPQRTSTAHGKRLHRGSQRSSNNPYHGAGGNQVKPQVEVEMIDLIRGRTLNDTIVFVTEAQNLINVEVETLLTRAGTNTRFFLDGNVDQIDPHYLSKANNGLAWAIEAFTTPACGGSWERLGCMNLTQVERSILAAEAVRRFSILSHKTPR